MAKKLYIGNLPFQATEDDVRNYFSQHGDVSEVVVIKDRDTGRSRGFAFVTFADDVAGDNAIATLNGQEFNGRPLRINEARERENLRSFSKGDNKGYRPHQ